MNQTKLVLKGLIAELKIEKETEEYLSVFRQILGDAKGKGEKAQAGSIMAVALIGIEIEESQTK